MERFANVKEVSANNPIFPINVSAIFLTDQEGIAEFMDSDRRIRMEYKYWLFSLRWE